MLRPKNHPLAPLAWLTAVVAAAALGAAACGTTSPQAGPSQPATSQPATSQPAPASPTPSTTATPVNCPGGWRTGPLTATGSGAIPPVPVATAIRTASHPECRFDRLVIDIGKAVPGYSVRFVPQVVRDGSGLPVTMPGSKYLEIVLTPAQGHRDDGTATLPAGVRTVSYPMLRAYTVAGDFEGYLTVALGLAGQARYRVGELPGRLYLDVSW